MVSHNKWVNLIIHHNFHHRYESLALLLCYLAYVSFMKFNQQVEAWVKSKISKTEPVSVKVSHTDDVIMTLNLGLSPAGRTNCEYIRQATTKAYTTNCWTVNGLWYSSKLTPILLVPGLQGQTSSAVYHRLDEWTSVEALSVPKWPIWHTLLGSSQKSQFHSSGWKTAAQKVSVLKKVECGFRSMRRFRVYTSL